MDIAVRLEQLETATIYIFLHCPASVYVIFLGDVKMEAQSAVFVRIVWDTCPLCISFFNGFVAFIRSKFRI